MDGVKNGQTKIKPGEFPTFVYPSGRTFDPDHRGRGLLRSETLVRVSCHKQICVNAIDNYVKDFPPPIHRRKLRCNWYLPQGRQEVQGSYTWHQGTCARDHCLRSGSREFTILHHALTDDRRRVALVSRRSNLGPTQTARSSLIASGDTLSSSLILKMVCTQVGSETRWSGGECKFSSYLITHLTLVPVRHRV
jgi:hypothetical protein